jgi:hypothetical protein
MKTTNKMELELSHDEISKMSESKFKAIINKSEKFQSVKFQTANYLTAFILSRKQQQLLFRLRSRTLNVK